LNLEHIVNNDPTYQYLERLANLARWSFRKAGAAVGLQPVQLEALHYLNRCNKYSDTPIAVAEYLGLTKGTVSQTLRVLENAGLLEKVADKKDRRLVHLILTDEGHQVIKKVIPPATLMTAMDCMTPEKIQRLHNSLHDLLFSLQQASGLKTFGLCHACRYHQIIDETQRYCGLTNEKLKSAEADKICREHQNIMDALGDQYAG
jgi:DNA-binding MarR family transcriptional regulator